MGERVRSTWRPFLLFCFGVGAALPPAASAEPRPTIRLQYERGPGAERCPQEEELRRALSARLGYDAVDEGASTELRALIRREGERLRAQVSLLDGEGKLLGERSLDSRGSDCGELAEAMVLAIAIAVDDVLSVVAPPPPPPLSPPPLVVEVRPPPAPTPAPPPPPPAPQVNVAAALPSRYELDVGLDVSAGLGPAPSTGVSAGAAMRWKELSIGLEGHAALPSSHSLRTGGEVRAALTRGAIVPCLRVDPLGVCGVVSLGVLSAEGVGVPNARTATSPYLGAGTRLALEWVPPEGVGLRVHAEAALALIRTTVGVGARDAWTMSPIAASLGASAVFRIR